MTKSYPIKHDIFYDLDSSSSISQQQYLKFKNSDCTHYKEPVCFNDFFEKPRYVLLSELALINNNKQLTSFLNKTCWIKTIIIIDDLDSTDNPVFLDFKNYLANQIALKLLKSGLKTLFGFFV